MRPVKALWGASWLLAACRASAAILIGADENESFADGLENERNAVAS